MAAITVVQYPGLARGTTLSPPCGKVRMALDAKGLDFETKTLWAPLQVRSFNRRQRVPVLLIAGETIPDSSDILDVLEQRYPDPPLNVEDARGRAEVHVLEQWAGDVLYFYGVMLRAGDDAAFARLKRLLLGRLPAPLRWIAGRYLRRTVRKRLTGQGVWLKGRDVAFREACRCLDALEARLGDDPFLVGGRLTRADLSMVAVLDQWAVEAITPNLAAEVAARPRVTALRQRVHERARDVTRA